MNSYFYNIVGEKKESLIIEEFLLGDEDLRRYLEKLMETDKYGKNDSGMRNKIRDAIRDSSFEKVLENSNDTLKARIFFDMPENIDWFFRIYEDRYRYSIWLNNENFTSFCSSLPISIEDWGNYAKEVLEDPEILKLFVEIDENREKISKSYEYSRMIEKLQEYVDEHSLDEISTTITEYFQKIKQISNNGE